MSAISFMGQTVLLIEPEPLIALDLAITLIGADAAVVSVPSAEEGISRLRSAEIHGVVIGARNRDTVLLRERLEKDYIPFVVFSANPIQPGNHWTFVPKASPPDEVVTALYHRMIAANECQR